MGFEAAAAPLAGAAGEECCDGSVGLSLMIGSWGMVPGPGSSLHGEHMKSPGCSIRVSMAGCCGACARGMLQATGWRVDRLDRSATDHEAALGAYCIVMLWGG